MDYREIVEHIRTSYHEAAHAVIAERLGRRVLRASIEPDARRRGHVLHSDPFITVEQAAALLATGSKQTTLVGRDTRLALAGAVAELIHLGDYDQAGAQSDIDSALLRLMETGPIGDRFHAAFEEACRLVEQEWPAVQRVAALLREHGTIDGDAIREALKQLA